MRINGVVAIAPTEEILVLPRDPDPIVFRARAANDMDLFHTLCPEPKAQGVLTKDGWHTDTKDPGYLKALEHHSHQRMSFLIIKTLEPSKIEWSKVKMDVPKTWNLWEEELATVLTKIEIQRVIQLVLDANSLNEDKLEKARQSFLHGQARAQSESCSPATAPASTPSGVPAAE